jgi:WD40 repeat protein
MNHASLSPDGKLLASVGDVSPLKTPVVYFHRKVVDMEASLQFDPQTNERMSYYTWRPCANSRLDPGLDSSFCTSFSPSGHLCAIGSQDSTIIVYDTRRLDETDQDAIITVLQSSRPGIEHGAVRSLRFCPGPWDLLIWTEHTGRACIADVRDGCRSRQTLQLRVDEDDFEVIDTLEESPASHLIDPQLRDTDDADFYWRYRRYIAQGDAAASNFAADYNEASTERRRLQRQAREESPSDFSEREREIFDALRSSRGEAGLSEDQGISINYLPPPRQRSQERSTAPLAVAEAYINSSRDLAATPSSIRDFIRSERHQDPDRPRRRTFEPRRQASLFLSPTRGTSSALPIARTSSTATSSSHTTISQADPTDPWRTIEAAMAAGPLSDSSNRVRHEREAEMEENSRRNQDTALRWGQRRSEVMITQLEHQRAQEIQARLELRRRERRRRELAAPSSLYGDEHEHPFYGPATSGSAITPDGRKL